jgi:hypothetical protein
MTPNASTRAGRLDVTRLDVRSRDAEHAPSAST